MPYITRDDLILAAGGDERLRQLTEDDDAFVASVIARAEGTAHKYLGRLYGIPLAEPVDDDIKQLIADESIYHLKLRRGMVTESDQLAHEERIAEFKAYGSGEVAAPSTATKARAVRNLSSGPGDTKAVSRDALKGFS